MMETIVIEVWLPYDLFFFFAIVVMTIAMGVRFVWRLIPVIGG